jgi:putative membrane-bound dehydrogenase-like protein
MKQIRSLVVVLSLILGVFTGVAAHAATGPIRVLYLGAQGNSSAERVHILMRELGPKAIWFDYQQNPDVVTPSLVDRYDVVLRDAPADRFKRPSADQPKMIVLNFPDDPSIFNEEFLNEIVKGIVDAVSDTRRAEWETFVAGRETEIRVASDTIANYERRPEPLTLQEPFSVKGSMERTQVPADMHLELFAAEPDIAKPIAFAWDERGRLWVCETRDYPHGVQPNGEGNDSIKICEDTDGDGRADKFTVFADKLNIPTSLVFVNGGVIVTQPPRMLFLKDTNGDDKADVREVIMEGWGIGDTHAQANNLHYGYDNWIYGCVGYSGFRGNVGGKDLRFAQGTYRFKPDGSQLEFLHQFSNNSWGQSVNEFGDQFGGTANNAPIFYGGIPASLVPQGMRVMTAKKINVEDKVHTITPNFRQVDVFGGYTAAAGSAFIYSDNLPPRMQGMAMVCEPTMKTISLMDVQPIGAGYVAEDGFNLVASSDEWMSPVFAEVGPDGAVWFSDWQNFIIQHNPTPNAGRGGYDAKTGVGGAHENPLRDHARGRIYRVVWKDAKKPAITSLAGANTVELVAALGSGNQFWCVAAQRLLVQDDHQDAVPALKKIVKANDGSIAAIHALWTLEGLKALDDDTHRFALLAKDAGLRRNAVRALDADDHSRVLYFSSGVISDPDQITRLAALVKLAEFSTDKDIQSIVKSLATKPEITNDEWTADALRLLVKVHQAEAYREGPNLLPNPDLEIAGADGLPEGWKRRDYQSMPANDKAVWEIVTDKDQIHGGARAVRCVAGERADTSIYADVELKPNTQYRLSGWVRSRSLQGKISFNDHLNRVETERVTAWNNDWSEVEVVFMNGDATRGSINILMVAKGEGYFDDVKLCELLPVQDPGMTVTSIDPVRGREIFFKHPAACVLCHQLKGEGSTVGPALDGLATRQTPEYIRESLLEPSKQLAKGFEQLELSPMPPMGDIFNAQELADVQAFLSTLK